MSDQTIFALSSAHGKSGVAVIRISGDNLSELFERIINKKEHTPRHAYYTNFRDENGDLIDQCVAVYFNAPHSFTGEDMIEIYTHGAMAVINKTFEFTGKEFITYPKMKEDISDNEEKLKKEIELIKKYPINERNKFLKN